ncbi:hypothetical protein HHI36_013826 [Cryptolaemus montrouzieri]|uniref:Uncharacterized protein n=1 Tax=Cryptolaemus montrouzieri TaxID=559131 RepID=A0ABD2N0X0_9CUCU
MVLWESAKLNIGKTQLMKISCSIHTNYNPPTFQDITLKTKNTSKILDIYIGSRIDWRVHVEAVPNTLTLQVISGIVGLAASLSYYYASGFIPQKRHITNLLGKGIQLLIGQIVNSYLRCFAASLFSLQTYYRCTASRIFHQSV